MFVISKHGLTFVCKGLVLIVKVTLDTATNKPSLMFASKARSLP